MSRDGKSSRKNGLSASILLAATVGLLALPSAVLAFSSRFEPKADASGEVLDQALHSVPLAVRLAPALPIHSLGKGQMFRFTPAGTENRPDRSVTVAVRVDPRTAQTVSVQRGNSAISEAAPGATALQIAPTAFNLGVSRGYHSFAQGLVAPADGRKSDAIELGNLRVGAGLDNDPSRFSPKIVLDQKPAPGRAPRTFAGSDELVDVGGSYSLTRNFDVTAGVRYSSQDRERLRPLTDGKKDNQAVYVGTQFRF